MNVVRAGSILGRGSEGIECSVLPGTMTLPKQFENGLGGIFGAHHRGINTQVIVMKRRLVEI
jgi:hypothetical protein